jgi:hypothetical protein
MIGMMPPITPYLLSAIPWARPAGLNVFTGVAGGLLTQTS